jgi:hypothetical protein
MKKGGRAAVPLKRDYFKLVDDEDNYECQLAGCGSQLSGTRTTSFYIHMREEHPEELRYLICHDDYGRSSNTEVTNLITKFEKQPGTKSRKPQMKVESSDDSTEEFSQPKRKPKSSRRAKSSAVVDVDDEDNQSIIQDTFVFQEQGFVAINPVPNEKNNIDKLKKQVSDEVKSLHKEFLVGDQVSFVKVKNKEILTNPYLVKKINTMREKTHGGPSIAPTITVGDLFIVWYVFVSFYSFLI